MLTTGVDIIEISRVRSVLERYTDRFQQRVFTAGEIAYCKGRAPNLAARFAAKEATMKALGTGVRGVGWKDIEVVRQPSGAPSIQLYGRAEDRAQLLGVTEIALSISHSQEYAVAFVVAQCQPKI
ncbi:MAG: holo-ACP synthase [Chloroflexi bacterium]|nr:holo-ACP synthase [Chloroflexota bacterium]MDA1219197.1 holo-ACP synthase [Chloroflexota bacterium]PKB57610.1 MAG: holo-[acyl-carrier-protein] synthase [SAR202 cluster bacterium Casp-Chloro-G3]